jgi:hypothetical protein
VARAAVGWDWAATESPNSRRAQKFQEAGLARRVSSTSETLAAAVCMSRVAVDGEPITFSEGHGQEAAPAKHYRPDADAVAELLRLGLDAAAHAEKLTKRVDPVAGKPNYPWRKNKLQLARNTAAALTRLARARGFLCARGAQE